MSAQIIFVSLFLGIVSGQQPVVLQVSGPVDHVRVMLGSQEVAAMTRAPWSAVVDFGPELAPRELAAIAYDADDREIARAAQVINLPRPMAEFEIMLDGDDVALTWRHLMNARPTRATLTIDGKPLALDGSLHARLPKLDREMPHLLAAELRFQDGFVARRELVIESWRSASTGTQLTPIAVRETSPVHPPSWDRCLVTPDGRAVRTTAVEKQSGLVIVVRNPDVREIAQGIGITRSIGLARRASPLDDGTAVRVVWPVAAHLSDGKGTTSILFPSSGTIGAPASMLTALLMSFDPKRGEEDKRQFTDAVAVAGLQTLGAQRRAVVLVLSSTADASDHDPAAVRRYLQSLGVPLFVWSVRGPRPDLAEAWGEVEDISNLRKLDEASKRLRKSLEEQRVAWVEVDPVTALTLQAKAECGIEPLAHAPPSPAAREGHSASDHPIGVSRISSVRLTAAFDLERCHSDHDD